MTVKLVGSTSGSVSLQAPASTTGGAHRVLTLPDADGTIATTTTGGKLLQVVSTAKTDTASETIAAGATGNDITGLTVSITPSNASNKIFLTCTLSASSTSMGFSFYKDGSILSGAIGDASGSKARVFATYDGSGYQLHSSTIQYLDTAGGTSAITYSIRIFNTSIYSQTTAINYNSTARSALGAGSLDYVGVSTITAMEIAA